MKYHTDCRREEIKMDLTQHRLNPTWLSLVYLSVLAYFVDPVASDGASGCPNVFTAWSPCRKPDFIKERQNVGCWNVVERMECNPPPAGCGDFGEWTPSKESCSSDSMQTRTRAHCPDRVEARLCLPTASATCSATWEEWSTCEEGLQHRENPSCGMVEARECGAPSASCGSWQAWTPPIPDLNQCAANTIYMRHRENCPWHTEVRVCPAETCADLCSPNADCDRINNTCQCKAGYEGDGRTCDLIDPCQDNDCGAHSTCLPDGKGRKCQCDDGWTGKASAAGTIADPCVDQDECATNAHECPPHSACQNTPGSYKCTCLKGFVSSETREVGGLVPHTGTCTDRDECAEGGGDEAVCGAAGVCRNTEGSFVCECRSGFRKNAEGRCVDIDECAEGSGCSASAVCINTKGGFACTCPEGFRGNGSLEDPCHKVDHCLENPTACGPNSTCRNEDFGSHCVCDDGFKGEGTAASPCVDIDECSVVEPRHDCDSNAHCTNTEGSFSCACNEGFTGSGKGAGSCTDVDECANGTHTCAPEATCTNTPGSYTCACPKEGYTGDGHTCTDINECVELEQACHPSATCENTPGSYACNCLPGFHGDGHECADIDECGDSSHNCGSHASCLNTIGAFVCKCDDGYELPASKASITPAGSEAQGNRVDCQDVNECETRKELLPENSTCTNTDGSFEWGCRKGYEKKGQACQKINFCALGECSPFATCEEIEEGTDFQCTCKEGYVGNGRGASGCTDVNECEGKNKCATEAEGGVCINTEGSYQCGCRAGYHQVGENGCQDVDECQLMLSAGAAAAEGAATSAAGEELRMCDLNATCTNSPGSYECTCKAGFQGDGFSCSDVDECSENTHNCGAHASCTNTPGSFSCVCEDGFVPTAGAATGSKSGTFTCTDIDECADPGKNDCSPHANCTNTEGSFTCACKPGFEGNGKECANIEFCSDGRNDCHAFADCDENELGTDFLCTCRSGYRGSGHTKRGASDGCVDINECEEAEKKGQHLCPPVGGVCENTDGSYKCSCAAGFAQETGPDGSVVCVDVDECADASLNDCTSHADGGACTNTPGSYTCSCTAGFTASNDGKTCTDINECSAGEEELCSEHAQCENLKGSYRCVCDAGYKLQENSKSICEDIDECKEGLAQTPSHSSCVNTPGGFDFQCDAGYERVRSATGRGKTSSVGNVRESVESSRQLGKNEGYGYACKKIDYCAKGECNSLATCQENATGTDYTCTCPKGYNQQNEGRGPDGCQDIDECETNACSDYGEDGVICTNTPGSYECTCKAGYTLLNPEQQKQENAMRLHRLEKREHEQQEHRQQQNAGFVQVHKQVERQQSRPVGRNKFYSHATPRELAANIDLSEVEPEDEDQVEETKQNARRKHQRAIHEQRDSVSMLQLLQLQLLQQLQQGEHHSRCVDIDECADSSLNECAKVGGKCTNTPGGYECSCLAGFKQSGNDCTDIDECAEENACHVHATCTNTVGSFTCDCKEGFEKQGDACVDIDECANPSTNECHSHRATCINTSGSYSCECLPGFVGDGKTCGNRNECEDGTAVCPAHSHCVDTETFYECKCNNGYVADEGEPLKCVDRDECLTGNPCPANASCTNTEGSYTCSCHKGFHSKYAETRSSRAGGAEGAEEGAGEGVQPQEPLRVLQSCEPIDLCEEQHPCAADASCSTEGGEAVCTCKEGFEGDGRVCTDIDECQTGAHTCDSHAVCTNSPGGFSCHCADGFTGDGHTCEDVDECDTGKANCDANAVCVNTLGSFHCRCATGFIGNGVKCVSTEAVPEQMHCKAWSPWTVCENGKRSRYCLSLPSKVEKICCSTQGGGGTTPVPTPEGGAGGEVEGGEGVPSEEGLAQLCGPWSAWSACPGEANNMTYRKRERADTDESCKGEVEMLECPNKEAVEACGDWTAFSPCGVPVEGLQVATREACPEEKMIALCEGPVHPPPSETGKCTSWGPWSACTAISHAGAAGEAGAEVTVHEQTRNCQNGDIMEKRFCSPEGGAAEGEVPPLPIPGCGTLGEWSPCQDNVQVRSYELCPDLEETRQCLEEECEAMGPWSACGIPRPQLRMRQRSKCEASNPDCPCVELEECVEHGAEVPPVPTPPPVEEGEEGVVPPTEEGEEGVVPIPPPVEEGEEGVVPPTEEGEEGVVPVPPPVEEGEEGVVPPTEEGGEGVVPVPPYGEEEGAPVVTTTTTTSKPTHEEGAEGGAPKPEKEEKKEEGGPPVAAIAGGIIGGLLLLGGAAGGTAYALRKPEAAGEAEEVLFEGEALGEEAEAAPEGETVIEIEDDAWADME